MKKTLLALAVLVIFLTGCQDLKHSSSHFISSTFGIKRQINLYAVDGSIIKSWITTSKIDTSEEAIGIRFFDSNNKTVYIAGTFIIQEL